MLRIPMVIEISDEGLASLRAAIIDPNPLPMTPTASPSAADTGSVAAPPGVPSRLTEVEFPYEWRLVEEREGETYTWPEPGGPDEYVTFRVYEGVTSAGKVRAAIGECERVAVRGKDRQYAITFLMTPGGSKRPIAEFLETDDYETTRDRIAIVKGKNGSPKMYDPTDALPPEYGRFRIETYRNRIDYSGSYTKQAIVARDDDIDAMLGHTLIQAQTRRGLSRS